MEVLISAAVLVLVVLGVLAGLDAVTGTAGANKARTVAATLAEKDQERLRGMRTLDIDKMNLEPYDVTVGKVTYHVESKAAWVYDASGEEVSCGLPLGQASYMRITSTVTSKITGGAVKPVVLSSIVAPQVGAAASGSLSVMVKGAAGQAIPGVTVTAPPATTAEVTNSLGCAVFGDLTAGTYSVTIGKPGYVDKEGVTNPANDASVTAGNMSTMEFAYDQAASVTVNVMTKPPADGGVDEPARSVVAANGELGAGFRSNWAPQNPVSGLTDPNTGVQSGRPFVLNNLFPFVTGYSLYSGGCLANDPSDFVTGIDYFGTYGGNVVLSPGASGGTVTVYEPTTNILVQRSGSNQSNLEVFAYPTNPACDGTRIYLGRTQTNGKLQYSGLPYGDYTLCSYRPGSTDYRDTAPLRVDNPAGVTAETLALTTTSRDCGDTAPDSSP